MRSLLSFEEPSLVLLTPNMFKFVAIVACVAAAASSFGVATAQETHTVHFTNKYVSLVFSPSDASLISPIAVALERYREYRSALPALGSLINIY